MGSSPLSLGLGSAYGDGMRGGRGSGEIGKSSGGRRRCAGVTDYSWAGGGIWTPLSVRLVTAVGKKTFGEGVTGV
jgi:hypothetical protein